VIITAGSLVPVIEMVREIDSGDECGAFRETTGRSEPLRMAAFTRLVRPIPEPAHHRDEIAAGRDEDPVRDPEGS